MKHTIIRKPERFPQFCSIDVYEREPREFFSHTQSVRLGGKSEINVRVNSIIQNDSTRWCAAVAHRKGVARIILNGCRKGDCFYYNYFFFIFFQTFGVNGKSSNNWWFYERAFILRPKNNRPYAYNGIWRYYNVMSIHLFD